MEGTIAVATVATGIGTLVLAGVTAYLAWQTRNMANHNRDMVTEVRTEREERQRPRVLVYVDYDQLPMLYLVIHNVGGSPAAQVTFESRPPVGRPRTEGNYRDMEVDLLHEVNKFGPGAGIKVLPAGAKISVLWGTAEELAQLYKSLPRNDLPFEGFVSYRTLSKEGWPLAGDESYRDYFTLNPFAVWRLNRPVDGPAAPRE